jgi:ubiquinone/menaquinone biosynthesis C-methylase UbiE
VERMFFLSGSTGSVARLESLGVMAKDKYEKQWENLGNEDPYWAVLTREGNEGGRWDKDEFFLSGERKIAEVFKNLNQLNANPAIGAAMDFGCGVGRISRALSSRFEKVVGLDISASMLSEAQQSNQDFKNIQFLQNSPTNLACLGEKTFDLITSFIVLQHMPSKRQCAFIEEFAGSLSSGGILVFQTPSRRFLTSIRSIVSSILPRWLLDIYRGQKYGDNRTMEMHVLPKKKVKRLMRKHNLEMLAALRDNAAGTEFESYTYYLRKIDALSI